MLLFSNDKTKLDSEAGLLNESSFLAPALGVTQFPNVNDINLITLGHASLVRVKVDLDFQFQRPSSHEASAFLRIQLFLFLYKMH